MDTVSMLNTMRFYCQPILPLVYDESMSYYETLCKVVGQLNTTGEAVNKLNEGLTEEISNRQAADAALDARIKELEATNKKMHILVFKGVIPTSAMPTRTELYNWVRNGDIIFALYSADDETRDVVYAASCNYNAGNLGAGSYNDFHFLIPLETTYDSTGKLAVKQKIVKLTIPYDTEKVLTEPWGKEIIEINTPHTSAEGMVNFAASIDKNNMVHANMSPSEFIKMYRATAKGSGIIVGVNANLITTDSQTLLSTTADITGGETAADDDVSIVFDAETNTHTYGLDLPGLTRVIYILAGTGTSEAWTLKKFETRDYAFDRYEGFQFTRGANNVITPAFGSTPKEVAKHFGTVKGGVPFQNLPSRLIDEVDSADYWNGVFDSYSDGHITFTFVTSNYATESNEMLVKIIELSATKPGDEWSDSDTWKYGVQEFTLPIKAADDTTYVDFWLTGGETYDADLKAYTIDLASNSTYEYISALIKGGGKVVARVYQEAEKTTLLGTSVASNATGDETLGIVYFQFLRAAGEFLGFDSIADHISIIKTSSSTQMYLAVSSFVLPTPNPDGSDNGKVPAVEGTKWALKADSADSTVIVGTDTSVTSYDYNKIVAEIQNKHFNVWFNPGRTIGILRMANYKREGSGNYRLIFYASPDKVFVTVYEVIVSQSTATCSAFTVQSAYNSAKAGGYTDTETNFYADLAAMQGLAADLAAI